jgi:transposase
MILGIDVAKDEVDVALCHDKQFSASGQFNNTPAGFRKLSKWLTHKGAGEVWACLESTGRSGDALAA